MKIIGSVLIFLSSMLCSYFYEKSMKRKILYLEEASNFISYIKGQIEYFSVPVSQIYQKYENKSELTEILIASQNIDSLNLDKQSQILLSDFFNKIGKGFKKEQIALCEYTINSLLQIVTTKKNEYPSKAKVFRSMSLFISISIIILLV